MTEIDPDKTTFCDTINMDYFSSSYTPFKHPMTLFKTRNKKVGQVYTEFQDNYSTYIFSLCEAQGLQTLLRLVLHVQFVILRHGHQCCSISVTYSQLNKLHVSFPTVNRILALYMM